MRRALVVGVAAIAALAPIPQPFVERAYSTRFYAAIQPAITGASNHVRFALIDLLIVAAVTALGIGVARTFRARSGGLARRFGSLALSIAATAAAAYLVFLLLWGWNYRRVPLAGKLDYDAARVTPAAAVATARTVVAALNRLHQPAHAAGWATTGVIDAGLASAFAETQRLLGARSAATPAIPKATLLEPYFRRAGVSGMTDPFFLETLVDSRLLPFERPLVVAHEWAHLAGYADEGEANFVGWLTCVRARAPEQYSGWLFLYEELAPTLGGADRVQVRDALDAGVRADLRAIAERLARNINPMIASAGWRAYDRYLKANRVAAGAASYDMVIRLVLGVAFSDGWTPAVSPREGAGRADRPGRRPVPGTGPTMAP